MKKIINIAIYTFIITSNSLFAINLQQEKDMKIVRDRVINQILLNTPTEEVANEYLDDFNFETGAWDDIDYKSTVGSGWKTSTHASRIASLSMYYEKYTEDSKLFTRKRVSDVIHAAWGYWFREQPECTTNWFPNKIGCPMPLCYSFLIMQDEMSDEECALAREIVFTKPTLSMTGANLLSLSDIVLTIALYEEDPNMLNDAVDAIESTIFIADNGLEGVQKDYSYHQHGPQIQFGNYGAAALRTYSKYANILKETSFAFDEECMTILTDLICEGYNWALWRGYMDITASGRHFGTDNLKYKGEIILDRITEFSQACNDENRAKILKVIDENRDNNPITRLGQKSFYCSDAMYHRTKSWFAALKMSSAYPADEKSVDEILEMYFPGRKKNPTWATMMVVKLTRVIGTEQGNDNMKGYYIADGAFYTCVDGDEYENSTVLWDWRKVPGITCYESDEPIKNIREVENEPSNVVIAPPNNSDFVGTCTDSQSGISSMILNRDNIMARKSWVVTDDFVLCLGSGIGDCTGKATLTTSIDQKLAKGDLLHLKNNNWVVEYNFEGSKDKDSRFYHDNTGYIVLDGAEIEGKIENREGSWSEISTALPYKLIRDDIFSLFIRHTNQGDSYRYIILPARTKEEVALFDVNAIDIIQNDTKAVIVKYNEICYITAFEKGEYRADGVKLNVLKPGIFMLNKTSNGKSWSVKTALDPTRHIPDNEFTNEITIL